MKKLACLLLTVCVFTISATAQQPKNLPVIPDTPDLPQKLSIQGDLRVNEHELVVLTLIGGGKIDSNIWDPIYANNIIYPVSQVTENSNGTKLIFTGPPGNYRVSAYASLNGMMQKVITTVTIKSLNPTPPGPKPPEPTPIPPEPEPAPTPPPIAAPGFRVMIIYESEDLSKYPQSQNLILYDQHVRDYLNTACIKVNNQPDWRLYDKDVNMTNESVIWQDAMKRPRTTLPWIIISNGTTGFEGPLPLTTPEAMDLIRQYDPTLAPTMKPRTMRKAA